ncbi:hypothetical protein SNEBB_007248 [Seison nebaliae]|nr:hypothetical protein SNEBB_007248 [Seison nebaliae]
MDIRSKPNKIVLSYDQIPVETATEVPTNEQIKYKRIYFLKTHKTASSTLQSILFRYANTYNLYVGIPESSHQLNYPKLFEAKSFAKFHHEIKDVDIICLHHRFNYDELDKVFHFDYDAVDNWLSLTIMRNPINRFISAINFYGFNQSINRSFKGTNEQKVQQFLMQLKKKNSVKSFTTGHVLQRNHQLYDMGIDNANSLENSEFLKKLDMFKDFFDFILMSEYFDESLVLLKHKMDVDYSIFAYTNKLKNSYSNDVWTEKNRELVAQWNSAEMIAYEYYNKTFWEQVNEFGRERMKSEIIRLSESREKELGKCIKDKEGAIRLMEVNGITTFTDFLSQYYANSTIDFDNFNCATYVTREIEIVQYLRNQFRTVFSKMHQIPKADWESLIKLFQTNHKLISKKKAPNINYQKKTIRLNERSQTKSSK